MVKFLCKKNRRSFNVSYLNKGVENLSGIDMSDVQVHYNSLQPAQLGSLAFTQGTDIHVAPGQESHLPHEAWHVVQQKQGRVRPTAQIADQPLNNDSVLEKEADVMGKKMLLIESKDSPQHSKKRVSIGNNNKIIS